MILKLLYAVNIYNSTLCVVSYRITLLQCDSLQSVFLELICHKAPLKGHVSSLLALQDLFIFEYVLPDIMPPID